MFASPKQFFFRPEKFNKLRLSAFYVRLQTYWHPLGRRTKSGDLIVLPELLGHFVMGLPNTSYYHPITFTGTLCLEP